MNRAERRRQQKTLIMTDKPDKVREGGGVESLGPPARYRNSPLDISVEIKFFTF
jgi:hypothetical protein